MYIIEQLCLDLGIQDEDAFADGASMLEDGCTEAEVRAYLQECFGPVLKNNREEF